MFARSAAFLTVGAVEGRGGGCRAMEGRGGPWNAVEDPEMGLQVAAPHRIVSSAVVGQLGCNRNSQLEF